MAVRHRRFLAAFVAGLLAGLAGWAMALSPVMALLIGGDTFFLSYVVLIARTAGTTGSDDLRRHAEADDEGVALILTLATLSVTVSIGAIFIVLNADGSGPWEWILALASVPLGWATVHALMAFHYAYLHYRGPDPGLLFPGSGEPGARDFLYASFTIGMTAQVSDVVVVSGKMRQAILAHAVASFFYNACILALAVNAAVVVAR